MSENKTKPKYINAIFLKKIWEKPEDPSNLLLSVGIKKEQFIKEIQALVADPRGFINLTIGRQKVDTAKYSLWLDEFVRTGVTSSAATSAQIEPDDSLPF